MKPKYYNDRKGPRMRKGEFSKSVVTRELYKRFIKENPEYKSLTWRDFYDTWLEIAAKIRQEAIYNPLGTKLAYFCGELKLQFLPFKMDTVDEIASQKYGFEVLHHRLDTRGKVPTIKWERRKAVKMNWILQFYAFNETREVRRLTKHYLKDNAHRLRTSNITVSGYSYWRKKLGKQ